MAIGTIVAKNQRTGMFVVRVQGGDFAVFELLDGIDLEPGDLVGGDGV